MNKKTIAKIENRTAGSQLLFCRDDYYLYETIVNNKASKIGCRVDITTGMASDGIKKTDALLVKFIPNV